MKDREVEMRFEKDLEEIDREITTLRQFKICVYCVVDSLL